MEYWFCLGLVSVYFICCLVYLLWQRKTGLQYSDKGNLITVAAVGAAALICAVVLSVDVPSAVSGGEKIYTNELPRRLTWSPHISFVITDNEDLKRLKGGNWNKYDKYGNYCIRYTKYIKVVLDIEKLD